MSQIKEMLLFAAGIIITVSLIFVGLTVFTKAINIGNIVSVREDQKLQALQNEEVEKYEGQEVQGNKIVSYVRNLFGKVDADIIITLSEGKDGEYTFTVTGDCINELRNDSSEYFINPMKKYRVTLVRDKNDSITCIEIKEQ